MSRELKAHPALCRRQRLGPSLSAAAPPGEATGRGGRDPRDPRGPGSRSAPPRSDSSPLKLLVPLALTMRRDLWREMF